MQPNAISMSWFAVFCSLAVVLRPAQSVSAAGNLLPYGAPNGDSSLAHGTDSILEVALPESFTFLGETFSTVHVNADGALQWGSPVSGVTAPDAKLIAPYLADVDMTSGGSVFYRSTSNSTLLEQVAYVIAARFPSLSDQELAINSLFIATWHNLYALGGPASQHNTFQCVLAYSGERIVDGSTQPPVSYVLFLYEDGGMQWSKGEGGSAEHALVEIRNGNIGNLTLPTSRTSSVLEVAETGNTGVSGQWLFRVDNGQIMLPVPLVGLEHVHYPAVSESAGSQTVCVLRLSPGEPSRDFSLTLTVNGGAVVENIDFSAAGPSRVCVELDIEDDMEVEYNETLTVELISSDDITILPSTTVISIVDNDVVVGWESVSHNVREDGGNVQLCALLEASHLTEDVTLSVHPGTGLQDTASLDDDYVLATTVLVFHHGRGRSRRVCVSVYIVDDQIVETNETLTVSLTTTDDNLTINPPTTIITIHDDVNDVVRIQPVVPTLAISESTRNSLACVLISGAFERSFDIGMTLNEGTALVGVHYVDTSDVKTILPMQSSYCFPLNIVNNEIYDIHGTDFSATFYTSDPAVVFDANTMSIQLNDNDARKVHITFSQDVFTGSETEGYVDVCVWLKRGQIGAGSQIEVNLTTNTELFPVGRAVAYGPNDPEVPDDYTKAERIIRFNSSTVPQTDPQCVKVPIIDDDVLEDTETFLMEMVKVDPSLNFRDDPFSVLVVITDNDIVTATVERNRLMVLESTSHSVARSCVVIHGEREIDIQMKASPTPGNATAGQDYRNQQDVFTFFKDDDRACAETTILNDFKMEKLYETFYVDFTSTNDRVIFNESRVEVIIEDTDILTYTIIEAYALMTVNETGQNSALFCISTTGKLDIEVTISFITEDGTAVVGEDYVQLNKTVVLGPQDISSTGAGHWGDCYRYFSMDDIIVEGSEMFYVVVAPHTDRVRPQQEGKDRLQVTIVDNDVVRVYPNKTQVSVGEGDGHATVCADLVGLTERPVNITITTVDDTAIEGVDYAISSDTIHFPSYLSKYGHLTPEEVEQFSLSPPVATGCVSITILDDDVLERIPSKSFAVHFTSDSLPRRQLKIESGIIVTIQDDDFVSVSLTGDSVTVREEDQRVRIQLSLVGEADFAFTASIRTESLGSTAAATPNEDYSEVVDSVELPAGYQTGNLLTNELTIPIRDDNLLEDSETFSVVLSVESDNPRVLVGSPHIKTIWIEDNDYVQVELADAEFRVLERNLFAPVCCQLIGATGKTVVVNITSNPGSAREGEDYMASPDPPQLVFPPSLITPQTTCVNYKLLDDDRLESVESFTVTISTSVPRVSVGRSVATVSLVDDDGVYVSLVDGDLTVDEEGEAEGGGGQVPMCVQMTGIIEREIEIILFTEPGTASAGEDFVPDTRILRFFPSDEGNQTECTTFDYLNDNVVEETEVFFVNLTANGIAHGNISILTNRAKVQIVDSDRVSIVFEPSAYSVVEGEEESVEVCAKLAALVEKEIVVQFSTTADTAQHYSDFQQTESQLVFQPRGDKRVCTPILIMDDDVLENEEEFRVHILASDPALYVGNDPNGTNASAVVTIGDNDHVTVSLVSSLYDVKEDMGVISVCIVLNGTIGKDVVVSVFSIHGTAQDGLDYSAPMAELVFLPSAEPQQTQCVDVLIVNDEILEDTETFQLQITSSVPRVSVVVGAATVRVEDEDSVEVTLVEAETSVSEETEGGNVDICVLRNGVIEKAVAVELSTVSQTAQAGSDFLASRHVVQFSPSPTAESNETFCFTFSINNDAVVENNETFAIRLTSSQSYIHIGTPETTVTIVDSDTVSVDFEETAYSVNEEDEGLPVCVELGAAVERRLSVRVSTGDGTALSGADFAETDVTLDFEPLNETRLCTVVLIANDKIVEVEEDFSVTLSTADPALYTHSGDGNASNTSTAVVTLEDNDAVAVSLVRGEVSVEEEVGEAEVCVRLVGVIEREVLVTLVTVPDTAEADLDYISTTRDILFRPALSSAQSNCTIFSIVNDDTVEESEIFFVELTAGNDDQVDLGRDRMMIVITDSDLVDVDFVLLNQSVTEGDGVVSVCVELKDSVEAEVTVELATEDDTAVETSDFVDIYRELVFEARGNTTQCVDVEIVDNNILESEEDFLVYIFDSERARVVEHGDGRGYVVVELGSGGGGGMEVLSGGVRSTVTIVDDDQVRIGVEATAYMVDESADEVVVCLEVVGEMERSVDVVLNIKEGSARDGVDYYGTSRDVTFGPESVRETECVEVQIIDDKTVEVNEMFMVSLSSSLSGSGVILQPKMASVLIIDNDVVCPPDSTISPRGDYDWPESRPGPVELPCQHSDEEEEEEEELGVAQRECDQDGVWGEVSLSQCFGSTDDIFIVIGELPYSCKNLHELLLLVTQATEKKQFEPKYVDIVARYFEDFADITERDGYKLEDHTCLDDVDSFTVAVSIIDKLFEWPTNILWINSTLIISSFETISENLATNPESADRTLALRNIAFSSLLGERMILEKDGLTREFSSNKKAPLKISEEPSEEATDPSVLGTIHLPSSLFSTLDDKEPTEFGVWFSLHRTGHFFPLPEGAPENDSVATPIISATVGGHTVQDLLEPVTITLRLLNQSITETVCAAWDHDAEGWDSSGCKTVSIKNGYVTCSCSHLTNFAGVGASALPVIDTPSPRPEPSLTLSSISLVGAMLAILALTLTLFTLLAFSKLRRRRTTIIRAQLCSSLLVLLLGYVGHILMDYTTTLPQDSRSPCVILSVVTHYFTLTSLIWLGSEALLMFRKLMFEAKFGELSNFYFVTVSATSWVLPFPFATIPAALNQNWVITEDEYCFISSLPVLLVTFVIPAAVALVFNLVVYLVVTGVFLKFMCKKQPPLTEPANKKKKLKKSRRQATIQLLYSTPVMILLFVFSWVFASLTFVTDEASLAFHLLSALSTAALGWFIFVYYIATAKDTRKLVHDAFCGKPKKNLNVNQFLSMESLGKASGIDESDSDSDYPERERRYGEFDVTYVRQKGALIEQKFSIRFMGEGKDIKEEGEEGRRGGDDSGTRDPAGTAEATGSSSHGLSGQIFFSASSSTTSSSSSSSPQNNDDKGASGSPSSPPQHIEGDRTDLATILEDPEQHHTGSQESPIQVSSRSTSQEDVNSDSGSPKTAESRKTFLPPSGEVVFTVTTNT